MNGYFFLCKELNELHLFLHKIVGVMCINSINELFGAISHPQVNDFRFRNKPFAGAWKGMAQEILCYFLVLHHSLKHAIQGNETLRLF